MAVDTDPLRAAARLLAEISGTIADLEGRKAEIVAQIETALDVASAHGFDRATVRMAAQSLRGGAPAGDDRTALRSLYLAAVRAPTE